MYTQIKECKIVLSFSFCKLITSYPLHPPRVKKKLNKKPKKQQQIDKSFAFDK